MRLIQIQTEEAERHSSIPCVLNNVQVVVLFLYPYLYCGRVFLLSPAFFWLLIHV